VRGPLSPSGFAWPPAPALIAITVSISAPASVRRGSTLRYTAAVRNDSQTPYRLDPCPDFVAYLGGKQATETYQLNCAPVGLLDPGETATFDMRFDVSRALSPGPAPLSWGLIDGRLAAPLATTTVILT